LNVAVPGREIEDGKPVIVESAGWPVREIEIEEGAPAEPGDRLIITAKEVLPPRRTVWSEGVTETTKS
jgi:hypothetical protein